MLYWKIWRLFSDLVVFALICLMATALLSIFGLLGKVPNP